MITRAVPAAQPAPTPRAADASEPASSTVVIWVLFCLIIVVPYVHWVHELGPDKPLDAYTVFPLLGVWAWSLMWTHYVYGTLRMLSPRFAASAVYQRVTGYLVLGLLLAHPGLLVAGLLVDTAQAPPASYLNYAGDGREWLVVISSVALLAFLSFEMLRRLPRRGVLDRQWRWVSLAQMAAMIFVFVHALALIHRLELVWSL